MFVPVIHISTCVCKMLTHSQIYVTLTVFFTTEVYPQTQSWNPQNRIQCTRLVTKEERKEYTREQKSRTKGRTSFCAFPLQNITIEVAQPFMGMSSFLSSARSRVITPSSPTRDFPSPLPISVSRSVTDNQKCYYVMTHMTREMSKQQVF